MVGDPRTVLVGSCEETIVAQRKGSLVPLSNWESCRDLMLLKGVKFHLFRTID